jgi:hypothetical protein
MRRKTRQLEGRTTIKNGLKTEEGGHRRRGNNERVTERMRRTI